MKQFLTLLKIEGKLTIRSIDLVFFGILMPIGIALLLGMIGKGTLTMNGVEYSYIEGSFASLITVGICATAFMGIPLVLSDYRDKKILKHYYVTPASPVLLLSVQVVINLICSIISLIGVTLIMVLVFGYRMRGSVTTFLLSYLLVLISMYGIGMLMASLCKSVKAANLVCTVVYFPMLFLSGATIPYEIMPKPLQYAADVMPLTQGIKLLKGTTLGIGIDHLYLPLIVLAVVAVIGITVSVKKFRFV